MAKAKAIAGAERLTKCDVSTVKSTEISGVKQGPAMPPGSPPASDRRADWWTVGDQERTGACVGWAVADGLLRYYLVESGAIAKDELLSVRFLWMAAKEMDEFNQNPTTFLESEGTSIWAALKIVMEYGCLRETDMPREGGFYQGSEQGFKSRASQLRVTSIQQLEKDVDIWAHWLNRQGPLAARLDVDAAFQSAKASDAVLDVYTRFPNSTFGHAVTLVGYVPAEDQFIIRNSWGEKWGKDGFAFATRNYVKKAFTEAWGIYR